MSPQTPGNENRPAQVTGNKDIFSGLSKSAYLKKKFHLTKVHIIRVPQKFPQMAHTEKIVPKLESQFWYKFPLNEAAITFSRAEHDTTSKWSLPPPPSK